MMDKDHGIRARYRLAGKVRVYRQAHGWSQETLAELSRLHRTYIGAVERAERNISIDNIEKIAAALGVSMAELLSDSGAVDLARFLPGWRAEESVPVYLFNPYAPVFAVH